MKYVVFAIFIFLFTFSIANAQVVINEIAWMGSNNGGTSVQNSNDEWIELYNDGNNMVDLSGWSLNADDGSPLIELEGTINAGEFFLLERSNDDSAPSVVANLFYTGALSNSGEILRIKNNEGVIIDTVDGMEEWQNIGGNNETKDTAQRILSSWITASPTPGVQNENLNSNDNQQNQESSQSQTQSLSSSSSINNFPTEQQIFANAGGDRSVIVGADSLFEGRALGLQKKPLDGARYVWNFGNGETKEGQKVLHYYKYPGEYVVMLNVSSGQYSASDRIVVNAYPAELSISKVENDFVELYNKSDKELNLSWWQLESQDERFMIPKDTIILPNKKLIFSSDITKLDTNIKEGVSLLYPNGVEVVVFEQIKIPQKVVATKEVAEKSLSSRKRSFLEEERSDGKGATLENETLRSVTNTPKNVKEEILKDITQTASAISSLSDLDKDSGIYKWILAILIVIGISAGIIVFASNKKELGEDIEIVE